MESLTYNSDGIRTSKDTYISISPKHLVSLALAALFVLYVLTAVRAAYGSPLRKIPGPWMAKFSRLWLIKLLSKFKPHEDFRALHATYGPVVRVAPDKVSLADPDLIPVIYKIGSKFNKSVLYDSFVGMHEGRLLENVFATRDVQYHKEVRSSVAQKYSLSSLKQMEPFVDACSDIFLDTMRELAGQPVDLGEWVQWYAFDVIGQITYMKRFGFMEERRDKWGLIDDFEIGNRYQLLVAQIPGLFDWLFGDTPVGRLVQKLPAVQKADPLTKTVKMIHQSMDEYEKRGDGEARGDFLGFMLEAQKKDPARYSERQIISNLVMNIFAGSDTTAVALRSVFYNLLQHLAAMRKVVAEIDAADTAGKLSRNITFAESNEHLPYLQAVLKEALRLQPAICYPLEREVPEGGLTLPATSTSTPKTASNTNASPIFLPAGTIVGISACVAHHNTVVYGPDAASFRPERWLDAASEPAQLAAMERSFLAFGAGARACLGRNISMLELAKFVPQVLRALRVEWADAAEGGKDSEGEGKEGNGGKAWKVEGGFLLKQTGLVVRLYERSKERRG